MLKQSLNFKWLLQMAWRDAKASRVRLLLFMASIIMGVAALVSIQLFRDNLNDNIQQQSKSLMGADYIIDSRQEPNERAQFIIDSLKPDASEVNFVSMVAFPKNESSKLVRVRGIQGDFPFYGTIKTEPVSAATNYQTTGGALVDATMMLQFGIQPGDSVKVGELTLPIAGALRSVPGSSAISTSVAPPVIIPNRFIDDTKLLQFGSRKEYQFFYKASDTLNLQRLETELEPKLDAENIDLDTHTSTSRRLGRRYDNVGRFLNLVAFIALLLGCIGIASSVQIYIKEKLKSVAILKCMGASRRQSFLIFLIQIAGIGILGGCIGSIIGVLLQELFPYLLKDFLPFEVVIQITLKPIIMGIVLGFIMSVLFAILPLLKTWFVSPLEVLRVDETEVSASMKTRAIVYVTIFLFLLFFSYWLIRTIGFALAFTIAVLITFSILAGIAWLSMSLIKRFFPKQWNFSARQSLLNLFRPNNQTLVLILSVGLGTFLISTLYFTKDILLAKTNVGQSEANANIIMLDVQSEQRQALLKTIEANDLEVIDNIPLVTMRMHSIKGRTVNDIRKDTTSNVRRWLLNHEFRTTYRDSLIASEALTEGIWTSDYREGIVPISLADNVAMDAKVGVGDTIVFNIQGVLMETVVGSIRNVDWGRLQLNFSIVFPKGVLENAPQFSVITTNAPNEKRSAKLQRDLVSQFPNVTIIDLRQVFTTIEDILDKVSWIINFMAFFSIITGIIVLIGSVRTSRFQRIKESVLLRTLGATNRHILKISALEYLFLGLVGSLVGILLALFSSYLLAFFVFEVQFLPSLTPFLVLLPGITILVVIIGLSNIRSVLNSSPLQVLRKTL